MTGQTADRYTRERKGHVYQGGALFFLCRSLMVDPPPVHPWDTMSGRGPLASCHQADSAKGKGPLKFLARDQKGGGNVVPVPLASFLAVVVEYSRPAKRGVYDANSIFCPVPSSLVFRMRHS